MRDSGGEHAPVGGPADRRGRHRPDPYRLEIGGDRPLGGDDVDDLGDLGGGDLPAGAHPVPDPRERALLVDLGQPAADAIGDEKPGGVGADVDAGEAQA